MAEPLLENSSFTLMRTNPKLTTNVKLVIDGSSLYLSTIDNGISQLNSERLKSYKISPSNSYEYDLAKFWKDVPNQYVYGIPNDNIFSVKNDFSKQYDMTYCAGIYENKSKFINGLYSAFYPLHIDENMPSHFVIFKIPNATELKVANLIDEFGKYMTYDGLKNTSDLLSNKNFQSLILNKCKIVKTFDLVDSNIGKYLSTYFNKIRNFETGINISWEFGIPTTNTAIDLNNGGFTIHNENIYERLISDSTIMEFDSFITKSFERNRLAYPNIINLDFAFNDDTSNDFTFNRYFGLYVNEHQLNVLDILSKQNNIYSFSNRNQLSDLQINIDLQVTPSIYAIKDDMSNFHKLSNISENAFILDSDVVNIPLTGFREIDFSVKNGNYNSSSPSHLKFTFNARPMNGDFYIFHIDNENIQCFATDTLSARQTNGIYFSINGSLDDIRHAFAKCVNSSNLSTFKVRASVVANSVFVYSLLNGRKYDRWYYTRNTSIVNNPIEVDSQKYFRGGSDNANDVVWLDASYLEILKNGYFFKIENEYYPITETSIIHYLDAPIYGKDGYIHTFNFTTERIGILLDNGRRNFLPNLDLYINNGIKLTVFSIFPIKDFDFDFFSKEYNKSNQFDISFYSDMDYFTNGLPNDDSLLMKYDFDLLDKSIFSVNLYGLENANGEIISIDNEYDRLKENYIKELCLESRINPYICKFVKDNDLLELPYRLNNTLAFGSYSHSPSFVEKVPNLNLYTHEWYYYSKYPKYATESSITSYDMYFDEEFSIQEFKNVDYDYFIQYFTLEKIGNVDIPTITRYSTFSDSSQFTDSDTFFRGVKIYARKKKDLTPINFNLNAISYIKDGEFSDYKFSALANPVYSTYPINDNFDIDLALDNPILQNEIAPRLSIKCIRNKKFKTMVLYIQFRLLNHGNRFKYEFDTIFPYTYKHIRLNNRVFKSMQSSYIDMDMLSSVNNGVSLQDGYIVSNGSDTIAINSYFPVLSDSVFSFDISYFKSSGIGSFYCGIICYDSNYVQLTPTPKWCIFDNSNTTNTLTESSLIINTFGSGINEFEFGTSYFKLVFRTNYLGNGITEIRKIDVDDRSKNDFKYLDIPLAGSLDFRGSKTNGLWKITGIKNLDGIGTSFVSEIRKQPNGSYLPIYLIARGESAPRFIISDIEYIESNNVFYARTISDINGNAMNSFSSPLFFMQTLLPFYKNGGFEYLTQLMSDISFASIYEYVNNGSPIMEYITINEDGSETANDFRLEFEKPNILDKRNYIDVRNDTDIPTKLITQTANIGYDLTVSTNPKVYQLNRYGGYYKPKFIDVVKFYNKGITNENDKNRNLRFYIDDSFGILNNFYHYKTNPINQKILTLGKDDAYKPKYSKIGEISLGMSNFYIFSDAWQPKYYYNYQTKNTFIPFMGTHSHVENKSFMASKLFISPERINIEKTNYVPIIRQNGNTISFSLDMDAILFDYILSNMNSNEFFDYVATPYIEFDNVDKFIFAYLKNNLFDSYRIDSLILYKSTTSNNSILDLTLNNVDKTINGYSIENNFNYTINMPNVDVTYTNNKSQNGNYSLSLEIKIIKI